MADEDPHAVNNDATIHEKYLRNNTGDQGEKTLYWSLKNILQSRKKHHGKTYVSYSFPNVV